MDSGKIGRQVVKMFIWSLAYRLMCIIVCASLIAIINNKAGVIVAQIFSLAIFLILPYLKMYDLGFTDYNRIEFGHIKRDVFKGVKIGLIISIPYAVCAVLLVLAHFGIVPSVYLSVYRIISSPFFSLNQTILPPTLTATEQSTFAIVASALTVLTEPVVYGLGYRMGLARISFTEEMGINKGKKKAG